MAGCGGSRRPNMEEEADMDGCGEQPGGGRRPNMEEEAAADGRSVEMPPVPAAHQGPESSDHSTPESPEVRNKTVFTEEQSNTLEALFKTKLYLTRNEREEVADQLSVSQDSVQRWFQNRRKREKNRKKLAQRGPESSDDRSSTECSPEKYRLRQKTVFTEEQLNTLKAFFKRVPYPVHAEWEQLAEQLSHPKRVIQYWFQYQREKMKNQGLSPKKLRIQDQAGNSQTPTRAHQDSQRKQKMETSIKDVQAQKQSHSDSFSPPQPVESSALPQGPHSSKVYYQNVGGPPDGCSGTEVYKMPPESGHKPPSASHYNKRRTRIWSPVPSITIDLTSDEEPSTSSGPSTSQMTTVLDNADNGPSTSSAPSTSQMTTALDNADDGSSTDTASLINDETTDSD